MDYQDDSNKSPVEDFETLEDMGTDSFQATTEENESDHETSFSSKQSVTEVINPLHKFFAGKEPTTGITLMVVGIDKPITFTNQKQIIIGRLNPTISEKPDVDLSGFPLNSTGVSRRHIKIQEMDGQWFIEDIGSRNGTWLNGRLLTAYQRSQLRNNDKIRAGNVTIIVLLHDEVSEQVVKAPLLTTDMIDTITILSHLLDEEQTGLLPSLIGSKLVPFADALIEMMHIIDRAKKRSEREIAIQRIEFVNQFILVQFTCRHEVLQFLTHFTGKSIHTDLKAENSQDSESEKKSADIARQMVELYFPDISPDQSLYYQRLLTQVLEKYLISDFYLLSV